jgi:hypothetical protein
VRKSVCVFLGPHGVRNCGGETLGPCKIKYRMLYMFTCPCCSSHTMPSTSKDMVVISKMGHTITVGLPMLRFKGETRQSGQSHPEQPGRGTKRHKGGQQLAHSEPHVGARHPQALYLSSDLEVSFTPSVWASIEPSGFFARITQKNA